MITNTKPAAANSGPKGVKHSERPSCQPHPTTSSADRQTQQTLYSPNGKICAMIIGDELTKIIVGSRHLLHQAGDAICLDAGAVDTAARQDISRIKVFDRESRITYRTTIDQIYRHGWRFNKGWGEQIGMRREHWHVDGELPPPPTPASPPTPACPPNPAPTRPAAVQLTLF